MLRTIPGSSLIVLTKGLFTSLVAATRKHGITYHYLLPSIHKCLMSITGGADPKYIEKDIHPGERLVSSILRNEASEILEADESHSIRERLCEVIYKRLGLPRPAKVKSSYNDEEEYRDAFASLVVEETRCCIGTSLSKAMKIGKMHSSPEKTIHLTYERKAMLKRSLHPLYCFRTHRPLTNDERKEISPGVVAGLVTQSSLNSASKTGFVLGTIHKATLKPIKKPASRNPNSTEEQSNRSIHDCDTSSRNKNEEAEEMWCGDEVAVMVYRKDDIPLETEDIGMFVVCSVLSYQRQFTALSRQLATTFGGSLMGNISPTSDSSGENIGGPASALAEMKELIEQSKINIPPMNDVQQTAVQEYLSSPKDTIRIIQG